MIIESIPAVNLQQATQSVTVWDRAMVKLLYKASAESGTISDIPFSQKFNDAQNKPNLNCDEFP